MHCKLQSFAVFEISIEFYRFYLYVSIKEHVAIEEKQLHMLLVKTLHCSQQTHKQTNKIAIIIVSVFSF